MKVCNDAMWWMLYINAVMMRYSMIKYLSFAPNSLCTLHGCNLHWTVAETVGSHTECYCYVMYTTACDWKVHVCKNVNKDLPSLS